MRPVSGVGSSSIQIAVSANGSGLSRSGGFGFNGYNRSFFVQQPAVDCTYSVSPSFSIGHRGGVLAGVLVTTPSNCDWITSSFSPGGFPAAYRRGTAFADLPIAANLTSASRTLLFRIRSQLPPQVDGPEFNVVQAGAPLSSIARADGPQNIFSGNMFTFTFYHPDGVQDLNVLNVLIGDALDARRSCYLAYVVSTKTLYLMNDAGDTLLQPGVSFQNGPGVGFAANSRCFINGLRSSVDSSGDGSQMLLDISFGTGYRGRKIVWAAARDQALNNSGWMPVHAIDLENQTGTPTPSVVDTTFVARAGRAHRFTFTADDSNGATDNAYAGTLVLNGTGSVENSQCRINGAGSSSTAHGNQLTLTKSPSRPPSPETASSTSPPSTTPQAIPAGSPSKPLPSSHRQARPHR